MLTVADARVSLAQAAEPRFERVLLLTAGDRVSLVFELSGEPRDVSTRRVNAGVLELDAGPVTLAGGDEAFSAPTGVRFVSSVSVQRGTGAAGSFLKARITLLERSRSTVRVVGRRVYLDFAAEAPPRQPQRPAAPAPAPAVPEPAAVPPADTYHAAISPALERLDQLAPFLISATNAPSTPVLAALGETLTSIEHAVGSLEVPVESRHAHGLLSSAIALAMAAVDPAFAGDRAAQTRQAITLLNQVKSAL